MDPHGELTAQITLDPHGNRAARKGEEGARGARVRSMRVIAQKSKRGGGKPTGQMRRGRTEKKEGDSIEVSHDGFKQPMQG